MPGLLDRNRPDDLIMELNASLQGIEQGVEELIAGVITQWPDKHQVSAVSHIGFDTR